MANPYFSCALDVWVSGNTVYARMHYWRSGTYTYTDSSFPTPSMTIDGTTYWDTDFANRVHSGIAVGDVYSSTFSKTVGSNGWKGASWSAGSGMRSDFAGDWSGGASVNYYIEGLWANNLRRSQESFTMNVYLSNWGAGTNYRELQCWTYNASSLVTPRRWQPAYGGATSGDITVSNSSSGDLQIRGNTLYTLGVYADNGSTNTGSIRYGDATTLPYKDTLTLNKAHSSSLDIDYSVPADGGRYDKTLQYSIDNGATWVTYDTISGGNAKTSTFTISNLDPNTEYTIKSRVTTNNATYIVNNDNLVTATIGPEKPTIAVQGISTTQNDITYGTSTYGEDTSETSISLYGDTNATPTTVIDTKSTTGDSTFNHTSLTPNTTYYYRSQAYAIYNGYTEKVYSDWSNTVSKTTPCETPTLDSAVVLEYETASTVTVRLGVSVPADGGSLDKNIQYRYKMAGGAYTQWTTATTLTSGSARNLNIDIENLPVSTEILFEVRTNTSEANTSVSSRTMTTSGQHQGPTGFDFQVQDYNTEIQTWLSSVSGYTNPIFIEGKSRARVFIPRADAGVASDNAHLVDYEFKVPSENKSLTITYSAGVDMAGLFDNPTPASRTTDFASNALSITGDVYDSLDIYTRVSKSVISLSYEEPTLIASADRLNTKGNALLSFSGTYARLQDNSLNGGDDINEITITYKVTDSFGEVITDWTEVTEYTIETNIDKPLLRNYSGTVTLTEVDYTKGYTIEIKLQDHFNTTDTVSIPMEIWDGERILYPANYEIELWDWKTNTFVADISYLVVSQINIDWELNDVEEVDFDIDLLQFEEKCKDMNIAPEELLVPYKYDIRIRRNGEYILGCQLVEANIQLTNNPPAKITLKGTGFLNLLKDQYIMSEAWSGYTYAQIARRLVQAAQSPDPLVKNPTCDIDTSYWLAANGTISHSNQGIVGDGGCIAGNRSGTGWITYGTQLDVDTGTPIMIDFWVKGQAGITCQVRERKYVTQAANQVRVCNTTLDGSWQHIQIPYTTFWQDGYIIVEMNRTDSSTLLYVDEFYVYAQDDDATLCDLHINLGVDDASSAQDPSRQVSYELQNIKDALMDLTELEDDNFDFDFSYDRTFNCYAQKGEEKLDLEVLYPGNVHSMTINRSASNLANKIVELGSGIGDEKLQFSVTNTPSRQIYGTRESIVSNSNVSLESTLQAQGVGNLYDRKDPTNLPNVVIKDGSVNPSNLQVGDYVPVQLQGDSYLSSTTGIYRVHRIRLSVDPDGTEQMTLTFDEERQRPQKKMVRYIRDSTVGNSTGANNSWNQIEALMLVGNDFVNVALNKTVYGSSAFASGSPGSNAVNGNINDDAKIVGDGTRKAITIDLGQEYPIDYIKIWHWFADGRSYYGDHLSVGTSLPDGTNGVADLETVLWAYDTSSGYIETSDGRRSRWLQEGEITEDNNYVMARYIRETHIGNSSTNTNIIAELDAMLSVENNLTRIQSLGRVYPSSPLTDGNLGYVTDWNASNHLSMAQATPTRGGVTIDLGAEYPIDTLKVFHYIEGLGRTFYGSHLSIGKTVPGELDGVEDLETVIWADDDDAGTTETDAGRLSKKVQNLATNSKPAGRKFRYIKETYTTNSVSITKAWHDFNIYMFDKSGTLKDIAVGLIPTCTSTVDTNVAYATDNNPDTYLRMSDAGEQSITFDLGDEYPIDYIAIRYHEQGRKIYGTRLSVGNTPTEGNDPLETIIWDDDMDEPYAETVGKRWTGWLQGGMVNDKSVTPKRTIRYIRDFINGSTRNNSCHWVEIQAFVWVNNHYENIAQGCTVTSSYPSGESGHNNIAVITDGAYSDSEVYYGLENDALGGRAVTVDLGGEYPVDFVRVWHYFGDTRTYNHSKLTVGSTLPDGVNGAADLELTLWNVDDGDFLGDEPASGKLSRWIQGKVNEQEQQFQSDIPGKAISEGRNRASTAESKTTIQSRPD